MSDEVKKAGLVAKKAMRKAYKKNILTPEKLRLKKEAKRQYRKQQKRRSELALRDLDFNFKKQIELGIISTLILSFLSLSNSDIGVFAIILAILILAAVIDHHMKKNNLKKKKVFLKRRSFPQLSQFSQKEETKTVKSPKRPLMRPLGAQATQFQEFPYKG